MKRKINALLLAGGLVLGMSGVSAFAQEPTAEPAPGEAAAVAEAVQADSEEQKAEDARAFAESLIFGLAEATEEEVDVLRDTGSESIKIAIANWDASKEELGNPVEILSQDVTVSEDGKVYTVVSDVKYDGIADNTKVTDTVDLNVRTNEYTISFDIDYPIGKLFGEAALNTLMGIGIVFVVLLFLSWLISNIHWIPDLVEKRSKKAEAASPSQTGSETAVSRMNAAALEGEIVNDGELIAVFASAIAAYEGTTVEKVMADGFVVRSIRKSNRENWLRA